MITPSDKDYKETKEILLGKRTLNKDFRKLASYIDYIFGVKTINIVYDTVNINYELKPRLNICFEFEYEKQSFNDKNDEFKINFDKIKGKLIADKFNMILAEKQISKEKKFSNILKVFSRPIYKTKNVFVVYSAFEPVAKDEANGNIPQSEITKLNKAICNKDLWQIQRFFSGVTFFLFTDKQVKIYENSEVKKLWANKYFDLIKIYDEFGYFKRDKFDISLDSKENFDRNYESNWYYYSK